MQDYSERVVPVRTSPADPRVVRPPKPDHTPRPKVHQKLRELLDAQAPETRVRLIVTFREELATPAFPRRDRTIPYDAPKNREIVAEGKRVIERVRAARERGHAQRYAALKALKVEVRETFWLVNALSIEAPLAAVPVLEERADVQYVEEVQGDSEPPTVRAGRTAINSDYLFSVAQNHNGYYVIGLIDTGAPPEHTQFTPRDRIAGFDCVNGTSDYCRTGANLNPVDDCWNHGTSSAGILTANNNQGDDYRGVTNFAVRSYKVYPTLRDSRNR